VSVFWNLDLGVFDLDSSEPSPDFASPERNISGVVNYEDGYDPFNPDNIREHVSIFLSK
jgi:hypothetical protein